MHKICHLVLGFCGEGDCRSDFRRQLATMNQVKENKLTSVLIASQKLEIDFFKKVFNVKKNAPCKQMVLMEKFETVITQ